ncbi:MAG TPA: spore germination protein [Paenibacillaceae bacterium]
MRWLMRLFASLRNASGTGEERGNSGAPVRGSDLENLKRAFQNIHDAEFVEIENERLGKVTLLYIRSLIDIKQLQEFVIAPLQRESGTDLRDIVHAAHLTALDNSEQAETAAFKGAVILHAGGRLWSVSLSSALNRAVEPSKQEAVIHGPQDSFTEQVENNLTLIRRRLAVSSLKSERFLVGGLSHTTVILLYIENLTNPELVRIAREKTAAVHSDAFFDSSHLSQFLEDHIHSVFPQFQQTDRPDAVAAALASGKVVWLVENTPFALIAPITFFDLFQSPEDYIHRWPVASFLRGMRFFAFLFAMVLTPFYVAITMHHYQMVPLDLLFVVLESRSEIPFNPFWEALFMMLVLEILKEASLRMPSKSGQTLGIVGGIVIGQAGVEANITSNLLIIHVAVTAIASFLIPNYLMTNSSKLIQFGLLGLAAWLGLWGITLGLILVLIHLNGLTSLKQPYFAPLTPFYGMDWKDTIVRLPLRWMPRRPAYLKPLDPCRMKSGNSRPEKKG